jgi:DNA-binding FadR family transcriptional regulator
MAHSVIAKKPLAWKVADEFRAQIEAGDYAPEDKLPTEPVLVTKFGFSRTVVREAIAVLRAVNQRTISTPIVTVNH